MEYKIDTTSMILCLNNNIHESLSVFPFRDKHQEAQQSNETKENADSQRLERIKNEMPWWLRRLASKYMDKYL